LPKFWFYFFCFFILKLSSGICFAANGADANNYSTLFHLDSNNNILNLNVTPATTCYICGGAGQGDVVVHLY
jgi:hypothetical protein